MSFISRLYVTAALISFVVLSPTTYASANGIQMLPPVAEGTTTTCAAGSSRVLTWDGQTSVVCATGMTVSGGMVGIGTASPVSLLDVAGDSHFERGGGSQLYIQTPSTDARIWAATNSGGSQQLLLNPSGGNVGIGTTTPQYPIDVNGTMNTTHYYLNGKPFPNCHIVVSVPSTAGVIASCADNEITMSGGGICESQWTNCGMNGNAPNCFGSTTSGVNGYLHLSIPVAGTTGAVIGWEADCFGPSGSIPKLRPTPCAARYEGATAQVEKLAAPARCGEMRKSTNDHLALSRRALSPLFWLGSDAWRQWRAASSASRRAVRALICAASLSLAALALVSSAARLSLLALSSFTALIKPKVRSP